MIFENVIKRHLARTHGSPTNPETQYMFYRCENCRHLVNWNHIVQGGCACGVSSRVRAAHLTTWEKIKTVVLPWLI